MLFLLQTLIGRRKFVLLSGLGTAVAMAGISFLLPKWYTATSSVFPPEPNQFGGTGRAQLAQMLQLPVLGPNALGVQPATIYIDVLKSRRVCERLLEEFELKKVYGVELTSEAVEVLWTHTSCTVFDNGLMTVSFEDRDPQRAAAVTNRYIELLDEFTRGLNVTRASRTKEFIEKQIELRSADLRQAEEDLRKFQEEHQTLELDQQVASVIDVVSTLTADAIALEVELDLLRAYASTSSQEYARKKKKYDEIIKQLQKFKTESARDETDFLRSYFPTLDRIPEVALELARRIRRVQVEEKVQALLIEQYEKARIEEARDTPTVQVLDVAAAPERKSRPQRKVLVLVGGILGLGWSSLWVVFVATWKQQGNYGAMARSLLKPLAADIERVFRKRRG
jgi:uncharacterized protein involved in exopolysaccharide biosynthesis